MNKKQENLPEGVAKECFLFEAIDYLVFGIAPRKEVDVKYDCFDQDPRSSHCLYYDGIIDGFDNQYRWELFAWMLQKNHGIINPISEIRFKEIISYDIEREIHRFNQLQDIFGPATSSSSDIKQDLEPDLGRYKKRENLFKEYEKEKELYTKKVKKIKKPFQLELLKALRSGKIDSKGFLVEKYDKEKKRYIDIDKDWIGKATVRITEHHEHFDFTTGSKEYQEYHYCKGSVIR